MFISETQIRIRYAETDQMGLVYYGNYATFFEVGRVEAIRQLGFSYKEMEAMGIIMPVVEMNCRFLRSALYDDLILVRTILKTLPTDHRIEFHHEIYNEKKKLLTTGKVLLYFLKAGSMEKTTMPAVLHEALSAFFIPASSS